MSTSPRIDAVLGRLAEQGRELSETSCPQALVDEARRIENELTAAMERIKRLEDAGNELEAFCSAEGALRKWRKSKEYKP